MRRLIFVVLVVIVSIFALRLEPALSKEEKGTSLDTTKLMLKLDEILTNQALMLKQFKEIKQELAVIKVRSSR